MPGLGEGLTMRAQRLITDRSALTREFAPSEMSPVFRTNGDTMPASDACHSRTFLAWGMNDRPLGVGHGPPLRLRVERQLGYKQATYVMRVEVVDDLRRIGAGKGGYREDSADHQWHAGI